mmetsp:Transcript_91414/g.247953  ORF Transcript_91414/g.247953 Transcript_91414/m.247953 type:complete len:193 (+) Transcript_91414:79-657(+)
MPSQTMTLLRVEPEDTLRVVLGNKTHPRILKLTNKSSDHVAYKVKTTAPKSYEVKKSSGTLRPRESQDVHIIFQDEGAGDPAQVKSHRFLVQAASVDSPDALTKEAWAALDKDAIQEQRLNVVPETVTSSPAAPSGVRAESEMELRVKYDELVQYKELLDKETRSLQEKLAALRSPREVGSRPGWFCCRRQG